MQATRRVRAALGGDTGLTAATRAGGAGTRKRGITTIEQYYLSDRCEICAKPCRRLFCDACSRDAAAKSLVLTRRAAVAEKKLVVCACCVSCIINTPISLILDRVS